MIDNSVVNIVWRYVLNAFELVGGIVVGIVEQQWRFILLIVVQFTEICYTIWIPLFLTVCYHPRFIHVMHIRSYEHKPSEKEYIISPKPLIPYVNGNKTQTLSLI